MNDLDLRHRLTDLLSPAQRIRMASFWHDEGELLAAVSAKDILTARGRLQCLGYSFEYRIPCGMAVQVVEALEMVDVDHDDRQRTLPAVTSFDFPLQGVGEMPAVE